MVHIIGILTISADAIYAKRVIACTLRIIESKKLSYPLRVLTWRKGNYTCGLDSCREYHFQSAGNASTDASTNLPAAISFLGFSIGRTSEIKSVELATTTELGGFGC